ncbi:MAG TPA: hypothetical protein VK607_10910 [Kofleriaceae bacterium]|nr:hypothetical protein [Kofleriaceae bacterium]
MPRLTRVIRMIVPVSLAGLFSGAAIVACGQRGNVPATPRPEPLAPSGQPMPLVGPGGGIGDVPIDAGTDALLVSPVSGSAIGAVVGAARAQGVALEVVAASQPAAPPPTGDLPPAGAPPPTGAPAPTGAPPAPGAPPPGAPPPGSPPPGAPPNPGAPPPGSPSPPPGSPSPGTPPPPGAPPAPGAPPPTNPPAPGPGAPPPTIRDAGVSDAPVRLPPVPDAGVRVDSGMQPILKK